MALLTITLWRVDGGGTGIRVGLQSDPEALPGEHEDHHRRLVKALFPSAGGVQRERPAREPSVG